MLTAVINRSVPISAEMQISVNGFSLTAFKIPEDECTESVKGSKESFSVVGFSELIDEPLQVRVAGNHERSDRDLDFLTLRRQIQATRSNFTVKSETVFVIPLALFKTGRLAVGDHENLFVRISPAT